MSSLSLILAAVFLPLFPFSMLFNRLFGRLRSTPLRMLMLAAWPTAGMAVLYGLDVTVPTWLSYWAVATALLYAFRALALRDLALWLGHVATSAWALLWLGTASAPVDSALFQQLATFSLPLLLLAWLTGRLEAIFGAAFAGSLGGLATGVPRLSGVLVVTMLAVIGTPLFPSFFNLLAMINATLASTPLTAIGVLLVWMLWAWAGMRMLQGLIVGQPGEQARTDIGLAHTGVLGVALVSFAVGGIWLSGGLT